MRFILLALGSIFFSSLHVNCLSGAKHSIASDEDKITTAPDTIRFYGDEKIKVPAPQLRFPDGIRHIHVESSNDRYKFLHDPAIIYHQGALIAAWYNCPSEEISGESCIRARRSYDGGNTWSGLEVIASDKEKKGIYYVPVQMLSLHNVLYAFVGKMSGHDRIINTTTYKYDELRKTWQELKVTADLFLPNCAPVKLENGNWIMSGRVASAPGELPLTPAVLLSSGDSIENKWRLVKLPEEYRADQYPETTIIANGKTVYAFSRADGDAYKPDVFTSHDYGETWIKVKAHDFNAVSSKLYAGRLKDGRGYIVFNYPPSDKPVDEDRKVLAIAISKDGGNPFSFSNIYKIQAPGGANPVLSYYPSVLEHNGNLYIVYTANFAGENKRQCELAIVPLKSLTTKDAPVP